MFPIEGLYEVHLPVRDLERSLHFYREVLGLREARRFPERECAFLWIGEEKEAMLGLWQAGQGPQSLSLHTAFRMAPGEVVAAVERLRRLGVTPLDFDLQPAEEPIVLAWMPAVSVYFRDPDGHLLEFLGNLPESAQPERGVVAWSDWGRSPG